MSGAEGSDAKLTLRICLYVSYMGRLANARDYELKNIEKLFKGVPTSIIEGLRDKFTTIVGTENSER